MKMFTFDPNAYAATFKAQGYVHIPQGLTEEYYLTLREQVECYLRSNRLRDFALGNKQQALYEFPAESDCCQQLFNAVGRVTGLDSGKMVVSERHIKAYDADANPYPLPHKDRYASQISVGFSVHVPAGSTLVIYPDADVGPNRFNSWAEFLGSLSPEQHPDKTLKGARRVEIQDSPRDVVMFYGSVLWHLRERGAGTTNLYLKLNTWNCDPIGEDLTTPDVRKRTLEAVGLSDDELEGMVALIGRRVDYFQRRFTRDWEEVMGVVLWGEPLFSVDAEEFSLLRAIDGRRNVGALLAALHPQGLRAEQLARVRRLAYRGVLDLVPAPTSCAETGRQSLCEMPVLV